jgi:hypothetical protein
MSEVSLYPARFRVGVGRDPHRDWCTKSGARVVRVGFSEFSCFGIRVSGFGFRDYSGFGISQEKSFNFKLSSDKVYCTNNLLLLIKTMLCSKLHCQIYFN